MPFGANRFSTGTFGGGGSFGAPSLIFFGPVTDTASWVSPDPAAWARNPVGQTLMRHYGTRPEGVNVYIMTNGTVTTDDPSDWTLVRRVLWGAHYEPVTDAEAALLDAAGYGGFLS